MKKRQQKKEFKKFFAKTGIDRTRCENCNKKLNLKDKYHLQYGTCNSYCYGVLVGVYI